MKTTLLFAVICFVLYAQCSIVIENVAFEKVGIHRGVGLNGSQYEKSFYIPRHSLSVWQNAGPICREYGLEFAELETYGEMQTVMNLYRGMTSMNGVWTHVAGMTKTSRSTTDWYWVKSGNIVTYVMTFVQGEPGFHSPNQWCLAIGQYGYADIDCYGRHEEKFLCQKVKFIT